MTWKSFLRMAFVMKYNTMTKTDLSAWLTEIELKNYKTIVNNSKKYKYDYQKAEFIKKVGAMEEEEE